MMKKVLIVFTILLLMLAMMFFCLINNGPFVQVLGVGDYNGKSSGLTINNPTIETQEVKVLVIEINPRLEAIEGNPKVSEYLQCEGEELTAINEVIEDFEFASHGYLHFTTQWEYLNEYPTYTSQIQLKNNTYSKRLDEETYLDMIGYNGIYQGNWYNIWGNSYTNQIPAYSFDYDYIIDKFDLVNRKNNNEFDQVWLCTIDPANTFETMMVGRNAYWINGTPIIKDCDNFMIANVTIARRDSNYHAFGHAFENIMRDVFTMRYDSSYPYVADVIDVSTIEELEALNLWERFSLSDYNSTGNNASVGNVHYPYNATYDYDYSNTTKVYTSWRDWLNYPNLTGEKTLDNNEGWMNYSGNSSLGANENKNPDRLYVRFWSSLFPHQTGYYNDGHLNNWWKYIFSLDYVTYITRNDLTVKNVEVGSKINVNCTLHYYSSNEYVINNVIQDNNVQISNTNVIGFVNGELIAKNEGTATLALWFDGKSVEYTINVVNVEPSDEVNNVLTNEAQEVLIRKVINNEVKNILLIDSDDNVTSELLINGGIIIPEDGRVEILNKDQNVIPANSKLGSRSVVNVYDKYDNVISFTIAVKGDVTGNGEVRIFDVFKILSGVVNNSEVLDEIDIIIRDYNDDGLVKLYDAFYFLFMAIS